MQIIPNWLRPGLPTTAAGAVNKQGTDGNLATVNREKKKQEGCALGTN